jgi:hypothetical protein
MKKHLLTLCSLLLLTSCAGVAVKNTTVATGSYNPKSIYIRPFTIDNAKFTGAHRGGRGERPIRRSLAPIEFAMALKEEMSKIAPTMILREDEEPTTGWLVEGDFEVVDAGQPLARAVVGHAGFGRSRVVIHVRITDLGREVVVEESKNTVGEHKTVVTEIGTVAYEFDLRGGSRLSGKKGSIYAPGLGYATPFDFKNAAERVMMALSLDPYRYGTRTSPVIR